MQQIAVWLVARDCLKQESLRASGTKLGERALEAARRQTDTGFVLAILREWGQLAIESGDLLAIMSAGAYGMTMASNYNTRGRAAEVFESIYQGRPAGMPAWGGRISNDQIWMLVSYVRSLQVNKNVTTENFGGKTVERTGH